MFSSEVLCYSSADVTWRHCSVTSVFVNCLSFTFKLSMRSCLFRQSGYCGLKFQHNVNSAGALPDLSLCHLWPYMQVSTMSTTLVRTQALKLYRSYLINHEINVLLPKNLRFRSESRDLSRIYENSSTISIVYDCSKIHLHGQNAISCIAYKP